MAKTMLSLRRHNNTPLAPLEKERDVPTPASLLRPSMMAMLSL
jgi:hypothetical protein